MSKYPTSYSKNVIEGDRYLSISISETIDKSWLIMRLDHESLPFDVIATGAYGQIQIKSGSNEVFRCYNPFTNFHSPRDKRLHQNTPMIAEPMNSDISYAIDITNMKFTIDSESMAELHNAYYLPRRNNEYWVMLNGTSSIKVTTNS